MSLASLARMSEAGIGISTVIGPGFNLRAPESWNATRDGAGLSARCGVAAENGRSVYITTRTDHRRAMGRSAGSLRRSRCALCDAWPVRGRAVGLRAVTAHRRVLRQHHPRRHRCGGAHRARHCRRFRQLLDGARFSRGHGPRRAAYRAGPGRRCADRHAHRAGRGGGWRSGARSAKATCRSRGCFAIIVDTGYGWPLRTRNARPAGRGRKAMPRSSGAAPRRPLRCWRNWEYNREEPRR